MKVYVDVISGDEMFSEVFPLKEIDDVAFEVDCAMINIKNDVVDISTNPSEEDAKDEVKTVNNLVYSFRLVQTTFDKESYSNYIKSYLKAIEDRLPGDRVAEFEKKAKGLVDKIVANFNDYELYTGESGNAQGMVALLSQREDGKTPYFTFFKDGLRVQTL